MSAITGLVEALEGLQQSGQPLHPADTPPVDVGVDAASAGTATPYARGDHRHHVPAASPTQPGLVVLGPGGAQPYSDVSAASVQEALIAHEQEQTDAHGGIVGNAGGSAGQLPRYVDGSQVAGSAALTYQEAGSQWAIVGTMTVPSDGTMQDFPGGPHLRGTYRIRYISGVIDTGAYFVGTNDDVGNSLRVWFAGAWQPVSAAPDADESAAVAEQLADGTSLTFVLAGTETVRAHWFASAYTGHTGSVVLVLERMCGEGLLHAAGVMQGDSLQATDQAGDGQCLVVTQASGRQRREARLTWMAGDPVTPPWIGFWDFEDAALPNQTPGAGGFFTAACPGYPGYALAPMDTDTPLHGARSVRIPAAGLYARYVQWSPVAYDVITVGGMYTDGVMEFGQELAGDPSHGGEPELRLGAFGSVAGGVRICGGTYVDIAPIPEMAAGAAAHLTWVINRSALTVRLYVNGMFREQVNLAPPIFAPSTIGCYGCYYNNTRFDRIFIVNGLLTDTQIAELAGYAAWDGITQEEGDNARLDIGPQVGVRLIDHAGSTQRMQSALADGTLEPVSSVQWDPVSGRLIVLGKVGGGPSYDDAKAEDRDFVLVGPGATMRCWRYTDDPNKHPGVELIWGTASPSDSASNKYADIYLDQNGVIHMRRRDGSNQPLLHVDPINGLRIDQQAGTGQRVLTAQADGTQHAVPEILWTGTWLTLAGKDIAAVSANGIVVRIAAETFASRTLTGPATGIAVTNGDGVAGNPTLALAHDLAALEGLTTTGLVARTATDTAATRSIDVTAGHLTIVNGDAIAGNPTVGLPLVGDAGTNGSASSVPVITTDAQGRVSGVTPTSILIAESQVTGLLSDLAAKIPASEKAIANGVATLGADGRIPTAQLPALAITDTFVVASQAAMLALTAERGDVAIRSDVNRCFILQTDGASTLANWKELLTPADAVLSVNGMTGAVTITLAALGGQPSDGDLTAIAALTTTGYLRRTGSNTWVLDATIPWASISGAPATYAPSAHAHAESDVTGLVADLAAKVPLVGDSEITGRLAASRGFAGTGLQLRLVVPGGGTWAATGGVVGALKIALPTTCFNANNMIRFTIKVFNYTQNTSFDVVVAGYIYNHATNKWYNTSAFTIGSPYANVDFPIRFGHDGTRNIVYIGNIDTAWSFPGVFVTDVQVEYSALDVSKYDDGWTLSVESVAFENIITTHAYTQVGRYIDGYGVWHVGNDGPGSGMNADLLDGLESTEFYRPHSPSTAAGNLNTEKSAARQVFYNTSEGSTNAPSPYGGLINIPSWRGLDQYPTQLAVEHASPGLWVRSSGGDGNTWSPWHKIWTSYSGGAGSGMDSDLLDGLHASAFVRNTPQLTDWDVAAADAGQAILISGATGNPTGNGITTFFGIHLPHTTGYAAQMAARNGNWYVRTMDGSTWGPWHKLWTAGNDGSSSGLDADLLDGQQGSYYATDTEVLHKAGGETITGRTAIAVNDAQITLRRATGSIVERSTLAWQANIYEIYGGTFSGSSWIRNNSASTIMCLVNWDAATGNMRWYADSGAGIDFDLASNVYLWDVYGRWIGQIRAPDPIVSVVPTGTAPFTIASQTVVANLNADLLDGNHASAFAAASHTHANATTGASGFMSNGDKAKLDGIASGANNYSLPTATDTVLGGVKVGSGLSITAGVLSVTTTGLSFLSEYRNVTAPNDVVPAHTLTPTGAEASIDLVLSPKYQGALLACAPDGTSSGGNKRGLQAVDLSLGPRSAADQVASGGQSVLIGGAYSKASGDYSAIVGGAANAASALFSAVLGGFDMVVSGNYSAALGGFYSFLTGMYGGVVGRLHNITHDDCFASGRGAVSKVEASRIHAAGIVTGEFNIAYHVQHEEYFVLAQTINTTATVMLPTYGSTAVSVPLSDNEVVSVSAQVVVDQQGGTANCAGYFVEFTAKRGTGAASVLIVGTSVVRSQENNTAWNVTITADTTNGGVKINAVGAASVTIDWSAFVRVVRMDRTP